MAAHIVLSMSESPKPVLTIWSNVSLPDVVQARVREALLPHRFVRATTPAEGLGEADVAWGQPDVPALQAATRLRWVQISTAGYTRYDTPDVRQALTARGTAMTNASHVFDEPCAEHLLAFMLAHTRQLPAACAAQARADWSARKTFGGNTTLLRGQSALLFGMGAIAQRLIELLAPFHMQLTGVRRQVTGRESVPTVAIDQADAALGGVDHVINILPDNASTRGYFGADRFARMKAGSVFYNIGRGATVDQAALRGALESGHLAAAYLDVTTPEPLPADDPLWRAPNCFITPHTGGAHRGETDRMADHFLANVGRFVRGEALLDRVV